MATGGSGRTGTCEWAKEREGGEDREEDVEGGKAAAGSCSLDIPRACRIKRGKSFDPRPVCSSLAVTRWTRRKSQKALRPTKEGRMHHFGPCDCLSWVNGES